MSKVTRRRKGQRGFTLIEIMVVVAIIAILAAVIIPSWMKEGRKGKFDPEIRAMFAEIQVREEQYKAEAGAGSYRALGTCPATTSSAGVDLLAQSCYDANWTAARVQPSDKSIRCTYAVTVGAAGTTPTAPTGFSLPTNVSSYATAWFYILGTCDMDANSSTTAATFFTASWDQSVQKQNYGQ